jgi:hypothetical protein
MVNQTYHFVTLFNYFFEKGKSFFLGKLFFIILIIIHFFCGFGAAAQYHLDVLRSGNFDANLSDVQTQVEKYYEGKFKGKGSGYKQWKRYEWWQRMHLEPDGKLASISEKSMFAIDELNQVPQLQATNGNWTVIGPTWNQGTGTGNGRPNCIAYDPNNANVIFVGFPQGGMWRGVVNAGGTSAVWTPMTDDLPTSSIASIAIHPTNSNIMYLLTGDGNRSDGFSIGLLKSTNGGVNWQQTGLTFSRTDGQFGFKVLINPLRPNTLFVTTNVGIYYSYDAGATFTRAVLTNSAFVQGCYDIEYFPNDTTRMASCGFAAVFSSSNGGRTWSNRSSNLPAGSRRIALAVSPNAANGTIYMYIGRRDSASVGGTMQSRFKGLYRSTDYGVTYTLRTNSPNISGYNYDGTDRAREQSDIDMDLAVSPTNGNLLLAGTHNIWRSSNAGSSFGANAVSLWTASPGIPYIHEDINFISFHPNGSRAYVGSDGGVYCSTDNGTTWNDITYGLIISQFYRINVHPTNGDIIVNGAQDAAGNVRVGATAEFKQVNGGDGMSCMIDYGNDQIIYTSYAEDLFRSNTGGPGAVNKKPSGATGPWVTPLAMNYSTPATIFYGSFDPNDIYRSTDRGDNWENIGGSGFHDIITCPSNVNRMYAVSNSVIRRSDNILTTAASVTWTTISSNPGFPTLPEGVGVNRLTVNPANSNHVWFCTGGYSENIKVYRSLDGGLNWENMSAGLPNVAILCIVAQENGARPGAVYVGTDIGVFYRDDILNGWVAFRNGLPVSPVTDLRINASTGKLRAGTYGRGIWESTLYSTCVSSMSISGTQGGYQVHQSSNTISFSALMEQGLGSEMNLKASGRIDFFPGANITGGSKLDAKIGPCGAGIPVLNVVPLKE